jgi:hypothetical protein
VLILEQRVPFGQWAPQAATIFGTSGYNVERELRAYAEVAGLRYWRGDAYLRSRINTLPTAASLPSKGPQWGNLRRSSGLPA